jgi:acetyl-CoA carboxylase carboxyl transferase alpha subunit/acetyl-CoA carboxylase carboxyl transferase beta subunit
VAPGRSDPLGFVDSRPYRERLEAARRRTGLDEAVLVAAGAIEGAPVVLAVMDFGFLGGSMGGAVGDAVVAAAREALRRRAPLVLVTASGGARMQEGGLSLMQMARTSAALAELDEAGVLTLCVLTDPTYGGVAASFGSLGDVVLAEPGARMGFAGPRVIEQVTKCSLPAGFQTAEFLLEHGLVDLIQSRAGLRSVLGRLAGLQRPWPVPDGGRDETLRDPDRLPDRSGWQTVLLARDRGRPTALDYVGYFVDGFLELHGDRMGHDDPALVGGVGRLGDIPVVVLGTQKGHTTGDLVGRRFGMPQPAGYRKSARLMRLAEKLGLPVVTLIDTPGAEPGVAAEETGQAAAVAENLRLMSTLSVPVVAAVVGEGGSGGALALAVADRVLALSNATYSVISPEGCAAILWRSAEDAPAAAEALQLSARHLVRLGIVDGVVDEPPGGAHTDPGLTARRLAEALLAALRELAARPRAELVHQRRLRFERFSAGSAGR